MEKTDGIVFLLEAELRQAEEIDLPALLLRIENLKRKLEILRRLKCDE